MRVSQACERNKEPIRAVLEAWLPPSARVLEIGSGTGQHAVHFCRTIAGLQWQPSERGEALVDLQEFLDCEGRQGLAPGSGLSKAMTLDLLEGPWPAGPYEAVFTANTAHIVPEAAVEALVAGAAGCLGPGGLLLLYGPFRWTDRPLEPSNAAFDAHLRALDPAMGLRARDWIAALAAAQGLAPLADVAMPAHNHILVFGRGTS
ncbi:MAG: DUF938 domain-containing protein [Cyanobacteriota bacterium]